MFINQPIKGKSFKVFLILIPLAANGEHINKIEIIRTEK